MKNFICFTQKELIEYFRTYKFLILLSVFLFFGMISSLSAKLLPDIISNLNTSSIKISMPKPTSIDAYTQFFKNLSQMGLIIVILIFGNTLSSELSRGTLVNMLSKGLLRRTVILSKYTAALALWTISYTLSALLNYGYTIYLFDNKPIKNLFPSLFFLWLFGSFLISIIIFCNTISTGSYAPILLCAIFLGILIIINVIPKAKSFNPISLSSNNVELLKGFLKLSTLNSASIVCVLATLFLLTASIFIFNRRKL
ncbi:ABC transporter permease [Clostridium felsineum]|uniref:Uncharacterized protein n=1 Tax=Clostridium felsineum TaxID=36839 RepID=A0A1S8KYB3_9CLOT|nr:ABC transporter permease subunit [Clostridium felsineum]URZ09760.1 hypothetical protein CROST_004530 [Clostridium felsineum]